MILRAVLVLILAIAFAASPLLTPGFGGFEPDQFPVPQAEPPVQPAGYAFAIWGAIYLWLVGMAAFGALRRQDDEGWDATRLPLIVSLGAGVPWLLVAQSTALGATALIWVMLASALVALARTPEQDVWLLRGPIGLYAGWLTAASAVSLGLVLPGWGVPPLGQLGWAFVALAIGLLIAGGMLRTRPSLFYGLALVWALVAILCETASRPLGFLPPSQRLHSLV
jgi:hypothetical protein